MKHLKIAYVIKVLNIVYILVTAADVLDRKALFFTLCGIFFLHLFSLNGEERKEQDNYFFKCKLILCENFHLLYSAVLPGLLQRITLPD